MFTNQEQPNVIDMCLERTCACRTLEDAHLLRFDSLEDFIH